MEHFKRLQGYLGEQVDNSALVLFRICFGVLVAAEGFGAIATGWVRRAFIEADYTFPFIFVDWLKPLPGDWMYVYFVVMGISGIMIALGWYYRLFSFLFFVMWSAVYFMQKTHYNNHYYFMVLVSGIMSIFPAHHANSLDVRFGRVEPSYTCSRFYIKFFVVQIILVYTYAGLNKIHPDWLEAKSISIWFNSKSKYPVIGPLLGQEWFQYLISYGGIVYDSLIGFMMLSKRTRKVGFFLSLGFHLFNSFVFQIGIFPYLMIALSAFFYPGEQLRMFLKKRHNVTRKTGELASWKVIAFLAYFAWQIYLPVRHFGYKGNVLWTEEGHRMAWQMMLRVKYGSVKFKVVDKDTGEIKWVGPRRYVTSKQANKVATHPDFTWQFAQMLKEINAAEGKDVAIYAFTKVSLNGSKKHPIIDSNTDLASVPWDYFDHSDWIITPQDDD